MPRQYPAITRGTPEYDEVTRILGPRCIQVEDESVTQISRRWLKGSFFQLGEDGWPIAPGDDGKIPTERRRIRIPRNSFLARPGRR